MFALLSALGCGADLWTKHTVFQWRGTPTDQRSIWWLWEGYAGIETTLNVGAVGGILPGQIWLFSTLSVLAVFGILYWLWFKHGVSDLTLTITLGCITGGILGNLYDRVCFHAVRDWIRLSYNVDQFVWPNFNVADSLLVCGAAMLVWKSLRE